MRYVRSIKIDVPSEFVGVRRSFRQPFPQPYLRGKLSEAVGRLSECCRSRSDWLTDFWTGPSRSDWLTDFWIGPFRQTFPTILNLLLYRRGKRSPTLRGIDVKNRSKLSQHNLSSLKTIQKTERTHPCNKTLLDIELWAVSANNTKKQQVRQPLTRL